MRQYSIEIKAFLTIVFFMLFGATLAIGEEKLPEVLRKKIEQAFPGAKIVEVEKERYKGNNVTEIELIAKDGTPYEVYLSEDGKIVKIEEEDDDFSWFK